MSTSTYIELIGVQFQAKGGRGKKGICMAAKTNPKRTNERATNPASPPTNKLGFAGVAGRGFRDVPY